jgi:hypothetical protein
MTSKCLWEEAKIIFLAQPCEWLRKQAFAGCFTQHLNYFFAQFNKKLLH